jgi:ATP-dependent Lon protease
VAMTGELSLTGVVLPVGGIKEKVLGAKRAGIREVILPAENEPNVTEDLQPHVLEGVEIHYVSNVDQALEFALSKPAPGSVGLKTEQLPPVAPAAAGSPPIH